LESGPGLFDSFLDGLGLVLFTTLRLESGPGIFDFDSFLDRLGLVLFTRPEKETECMYRNGSPPTVGKMTTQSGLILFTSIVPVLTPRLHQSNDFFPC
jgi:hypothetical protein